MDDTVILPVPFTDASYDADFYAWATDQGLKLREGKLQALDLPNLAEEIESMGRAEKRELSSRLDVLLTHLLKWAAQPGRKGASWRKTIREQRRQISGLLRDNPSLRPLFPALLADSYLYARGAAMDETKLPDTCFPTSCPWLEEQIRDGAFLPEPFSPP